MADPTRDETPAQIALEHAIKLEQQLGPQKVTVAIHALVDENKWLKLYERLYTRAVEAATPLQTGEEFAYLLRPGDSIVVDGLIALMRALRDSEAKREAAEKQLAHLLTYPELADEVERLRQRIAELESKK